MFILDSDHISVLQLQGPPHFQVLSQRIAQHSQTDFFVTIVSFHEQILGWNSYIARAKDQVGIVRGYTKLEGILADFAQAQVLPFDDAATHVKEVAGNTARNMSSMYQDLKRGAPTECDAIYGTVVREAGRLGVDATVNGILWNLIRAAAKPHGSRSRHAGSE